MPFRASIKEGQRWLRDVLSTLLGEGFVSDVIAMQASTDPSARAVSADNYRELAPGWHYGLHPANAIKPLINALFERLLVTERRFHFRSFQVSLHVTKSSPQQ